MSDDALLKPSFDEWMYWAQVVIDRVATIVHVYGKPPFEDAYLLEAEHQTKTAEATALLRRLHAATDANELQSVQGDPLEREEAIVETLVPLFREAMRHLPTWSHDMQFLLKSPWAANCAGRLASILFCGPEGREAEGIGSGMPENGRLPATLQSLLDRERAGDTRAPHEAPPRVARNRLQREDLAKLWGKRNSSFLRSAGRMD